MPIVSNTSPILNLALVGKLELLEQQFGEIIIPQAVLDEFRLSEDLPGTGYISAALSEGWLSVKALSDRHKANLLERELDKGESEVISLALELNAELLLIDERDARRVCKSLNLNVTGVIGILIKAYKTGALTDLQQTINDLKEQAGFYISDTLITEINKNIKSTV